MRRDYIRAVICVIAGYLLTFLGYMPALDIHESSIVSIVQQTLEIGSYKPIFIISSVFLISNKLFQLNVGEPVIKKAIHIEGIGIKCGACSFIGFLLFLSPLLLFFPVITEEETEIMSGVDPHFSVYMAGNALLVIIFHGILLFASGVLVSSLYMISFYRCKDQIRSYLFTLITYQSITFVQSLLAIPNCWKIDNLSSGWFQSPWATESFVPDILWCLIVVLSISFIVNIFSVLLYHERDDLLKCKETP